ncbi:MAG: copper chaperone PCu(A)C [Rhizobiales bacterium]|nr:copper chaperone PCu(A)C [Hyphomicrobiales bacterium]
MIRLTLMAIAAMLLVIDQADAHDYKLGTLSIDHPWARVTIANRPAAGYMKIINHGDEPDRVVSASSPLADRVELHTHTMIDGVMKMRPVGTIEVPAKGEVELAPGGLHLMIMGLKEAPKPGEVLPVSVVFEQAGSIDLEFNVVEPREPSPAPAMDHSTHGAAKP